MGRLSPANAGTEHTSTRNSPPQSRRTRQGAYHASDHDLVGTNRRVANLARGVTISATKRMMNGKEAGRPTRDGACVTYLVEIAARIPIMRPPAYVSGRLEKYPIAAAPKACTTKSVRTDASRLILGASRIPDRAANVVPITQAHRRTRAGFSPVMEMRFGSSTTARIATPMRTNRKK